MKAKRIRSALVATALLAASVSAPASAAVAADGPSPDVLCLGVYLLLAAQEDETIKNAGLMGSLYYAGRVQGANPDKDALDLVMAAFNRPDAEQIFEAARPRCAQEMSDFGKHWMDRGQQLQDAARAGIRGT